MTRISARSKSEVRGRQDPDDSHLPQFIALLRDAIYWAAEMAIPANEKQQR
jgi:hypothetical protein